MDAKAEVWVVVSLCGCFKGQFNLSSQSKISSRAPHKGKLHIQIGSPGVFHPLVSILLCNVLFNLGNTKTCNEEQQFSDRAVLLGCFYFYIPLTFQVKVKWHCGSMKLHKYIPLISVFCRMIGKNRRILALFNIFGCFYHSACSYHTSPMSIFFHLCLIPG